MMMTRSPQLSAEEWVSFPGGELEGKRPKALCPACRERLRLAAAGQRPGAEAPKQQAALCFECYRAALNRDRTLKAAGELDTASVQRFQDALPFEAVDLPRLEMLKAERTASRAALSEGTGRFVDRRRRAQIEARHALQRIAAALRSRPFAPSERDRRMASAIHAAELQLPDAWLPFVVSR